MESNIEGTPSKAFCWEKLPERHCIQNKGTSVTFIKDFVIFFGGYHKGIPTNDLFVFDLRENRWFAEEFLTPSNIPRRRAFHTATSVNKQTIILFGGVDNENVYNEVFLIDIEKGTRNRLNLTFRHEYTNGSLYRYGHSCHFYNDVLYSFGGLGKDHKPTNSLLHYVSGNWIILKTFGKFLIERGFHCSVLVKDTMYIIGGNSMSQASHSSVETLAVHDLSDIHCINLKTMKWEKLSSSFSCPSLKSSFCAVNTEDVIFIFGGSKEQEENELVAYHTKRGEWYKIPTSGQTPQSADFLSAVIDNNRLVLFNKNSLISQSGIYSLNLDDPIKKLFSQSEKLYKSQPRDLISPYMILFTENFFPDIIFEVEDKEIPAHKDILAARSGYFNKMFSSGMIESQSNRIKIPNIKYHIFYAILEYIYCKELELNVTLASEILPLIDEYLLESLKKECQAFLSQNLTKENAIDLLILSDTYNAQNLHCACLEFVVKNLKYFYASEEMMKIPKPVFMDLLMYSTWGLESIPAFNQDNGNERNQNETEKSFLEVEEEREEEEKRNWLRKLLNRKDHSQSPSRSDVLLKGRDVPKKTIS